MKKTIHSLTVLAMLLFASSLAAQQFSTNPEKPTAGDNVIVSYDPIGGPLAGIEFDGVAYLYELGKQEPTAIDLEFMREDAALTALLKIPADAQAVLFSFGNDDLEKTDNNGGKGYKTLIYKADRSTPVAGALGLKSLFYNGYGRNGGIKNDAEKALNLAKQELASNPKAFNDMRFASSYAALGFKQKDATVIAACKAEIEKIDNNKKSSEDELRNAVSMATALEEKALAESIGKKADEKFPNGLAAKKKAMDSFKAAKTLDEKLKIYADAKVKFSKEKDMERTLTSWAATIANEYGTTEDWTNFEKYFAQIKDRTRAAGVLNGLAWKMSGESLDGAAKNPGKGMELSARSLDLVKKDIEDPASKPVSFSGKKWKNNLEFTTAMYADTYALLLYKNGKFAEALKYQTIACEKNKFGDGEMSERYAVFYEKMNSPKETEQMLTGLITDGKATSKMLEQHKRLFLANNTVESAYDKYMVSLEKEAKVKKREEIEKKLIDENAPAFTLRNLKGEEVSLEGLRGKVLVLDFWATWCGPCKASFPGMQTAVNKFADRKDVEFLFIDTWENVEDKAKAAGDFIASKSYTFNVLMDLDNQVVTKFGVSGIPTKFVVDRNGKIRFKAVGFNGNDQELVDELSIMIDIAGGDVTP
ncbi:MAG: redoxin domain-containing protein [Saprospiraceae bacterium]|nr:redoxin domain-containing protein [Saprospiraceae bacterium]